jgi:hypothetical protein
MAYCAEDATQTPDDDFEEPDYLYQTSRIFLKNRTITGLQDIVRKGT